MLEEFCVLSSNFMIKERLACYFKEFITYIAFNLYESNSELRYNDL